MTNDPVWSEETGLRWAQAVKTWNQKADGDTIFYKVGHLSQSKRMCIHRVLQLVEHLKTFYTTWKMLMNAKHTRMATYDARKETDALVRNHNVRLRHAPAVPQKDPARALPTTGLVPISEVASAPVQPRIQYPSTLVTQVYHNVGMRTRLAVQT